MPVVGVLDSFLHYEEAGSGPPVVLLHGNPTSSHLWRHVLPKVAAAGHRCLAPDLIGMGRSGKPGIAYRFADHARYLDAWFDALGLERAVLVGQDWGGALAFDRAARHPGRVPGLAFMETVVRPMTWEEYPAAARSRFEAFRTPGVGERLVLDQNVFIEGSFAQTVRSGLAPPTGTSTAPPTRPATAAARCWSGPGPCRWRANRPMSSPASPPTTPGSRTAPASPNSCSPSTPRPP